MTLPTVGNLTLTITTIYGYLYRSGTKSPGLEALFPIHK
jgi:hypothetical protein